MRKINIALFLSILIAVIFFIVYSYRLPESFNLTTDFGRDIYNMIKIGTGEPTLLGPKLSLGGFYAAPYYYYFFLPVFLLSGWNINSILFFNTALFALSLGYFFKLLSKEYGLIKSATATATVGLLPLFIFSSHFPGNGLSYLPFLLIFISLVYLKDWSDKKKLALLGLYSGILITTHPINLLVALGLLIYIGYFLKNKKDLIYFLLGNILSLLPLAIFEVKHNFIMLKDTFVNKSYSAFLENNIIPNAPKGKDNLWDNFLFLSEKLKISILLYPIIYLVAPLVIFFKERKKKEVLLYFASLTSFIVLIIVDRFKFEQHFLYPVALFLVISSVFILLSSRFWLLLLPLILLEIYSFPVNLYVDSKRSPRVLEQAVNLAVDQKLVDSTRPFDLIQVTDQLALVPVGFEYKFFFRKRGLKPLSEYEYSSARDLLIFVETPNYDISKLSNFGTQQFGQSNLQKVQTFRTDNITIYKASK